MVELQHKIPNLDKFCLLHCYPKLHQDRPNTVPWTPISFEPLPIFNHNQNYILSP